MGRDPVSSTAHFVTSHSVLTLDARHPYTAKAMIDAQHMHRNIMSGFYHWVPDGQPDARAQMGVLSTWSVDLKAGVLILVVQARVPADWSGIPADALKDKPHTLTVDRTLNTGDVVSFRTVVNPTKTISPGKEAVENKIRGKRIPHTAPHHAKDWFTRRLQPEGEPPTGPSGVSRIGATTDSDTLNIQMLGSLKSTSRKGLVVARAEIKGRLTVTDPHTFVNALNDGIGRARAYGCGLLLIR
ncbi:type I-E CRISPR-associated protein Cas6/Cse3/CasE (plasmid) [Streptomyces sp. Qhu-G9]|nr:type I-E CRISPR-associated protein Cas6/Cse3/CasE [Streptomyces aurantiacus]WAU78360.1 type I-E CRISPR-associated protein Cas6/Cse3/CasE [Streptomyces aurantiacus]